MTKYYIISIISFIGLYYSYYHKYDHFTGLFSGMIFICLLITLESEVFDNGKEESNTTNGGTKTVRKGRKKNK